MSIHRRMLGVSERNELALRGQEKRYDSLCVGYSQHSSWFLVVGVHDKTLEIIGTESLEQKRRLFQHILEEIKNEK